MFTVFALACLLGGLPVTGDCAAAQTYAPVLASVPPDHWREVKRVELWGEPFGRWDSRSKTIRLPAHDHSAYFLLHEVAHAWALTDERAVQRAWDAQFWPGGAPRGWLLPYPASTLAQRGPTIAAIEDLAESYAAERCGWPVDAARVAWLYQHAPELARLPRASC